MRAESKELAMKIASVLDAKMAQDVLVLDVEKMTIITDYFVLASTRSALATRALADEMEQALAQENLFVKRHEGRQEGRWIVMDFTDVIVHLFHEQEREFYNLERLWMKEDNAFYWPRETKA